MSPSKPQTIPALEALEPRLLMDGDVSVAMHGSTLRIDGENGAAHAINIFEDGGLLGVTGLHHSDTGVDTTINGQGGVWYAPVVAGRVKKIVIRMRDGDGLGNGNQIIVGEMPPNVVGPETFQANWTIDLGSTGRHFLGFSTDVSGLGMHNTVQTGGNLTIKGGRDRQVIAIRGTEIQGKLNINCTRGQLILNIQDNPLNGSRTEAHRGATIRGGHAGNSISADNLHVFGQNKYQKLNIRVGHGEDFVKLAGVVSGHTNVRLGHGENQLIVDDGANGRGLTVGNFNLQGGRNGDYVELFGPQVFGHLKANLKGNTPVGLGRGNSFMVRASDTGLGNLAMYVSKNLSVRMNGNDAGGEQDFVRLWGAVGVARLFVGGNTSVQTRTVNQNLLGLDLRWTHFDRDLKLNARSQRNTLFGTQLEAWDTIVLGNATIRTGAGNDSLLLDNFHINGNLTLNSGGGSDLVGLSAGMTSPSATRDSRVLGRTNVNLGSLGQGAQRLYVGDSLNFGVQFDQQSSFRGGRGTQHTGLNDANAVHNTFGQAPKLGGGIR